MENFTPKVVKLFLENICLFENPGVYLVIDVHANDIIVCQSELVQKLLMAKTLKIWDNISMYTMTFYCLNPDILAKE